MAYTIAITGTIIVLTILIGASLFWKLYFLRKPKRDVPAKGIVSPASGMVVKIIEYDKKKANVAKGLLGKVKVMTKEVATKGKIVVIRMTPMDVHYQRAPIGGEIITQRHQDGKLLNAVKDAENCRATLENEKNSIVMKKGKLKIKIVQVAGFLARRIESYVKVKQKIHKGEVLGRINLGSQVLLVLPEMKIEVKEGQRVVDGETIIVKQ